MMWDLSAVLYNLITTPLTRNRLSDDARDVGSLTNAIDRKSAKAAVLQMHHVGNGNINIDTPPRKINIIFKLRSQLADSGVHLQVTLPIEYLSTLNR
jgi:hypothetical protein